MIFCRVDKRVKTKYYLHASCRWYVTSLRKRGSCLRRNILGNTRAIVYRNNAKYRNACPSPLELRNFGNNRSHFFANKSKLCTQLRADNWSFRNAISRRFNDVMIFCSWPFLITYSSAETMMNASSHVYIRWINPGFCPFREIAITRWKD